MIKYSATASGSGDTFTLYGGGSVSVVIDAANKSVTISGTEVEAQKSLDLIYNAGVWESASNSFTTVPNDLNVYLNGVKQRSNDSEYYTASIVNGKLTITFGYETYSTDWANCVYNITSAASGDTGLKDWVLKTSSYTAVADDRILIDSSAGSFTITLPSSPSLGDQVTVFDSAGYCGTNNVIIGRNGENIMGTPDDLIIDIDGASFELVYYNTTKGWRVLS